MENEYSFYLYAADLFRNKSVQHEVRFSKLAIQVAPPGTDTTALWSTVVKGQTDLALYEDAYASLMLTPSDQQ